MAKQISPIRRGKTTTLKAHDAYEIPVILDSQVFSEYEPQPPQRKKNAGT